MVSGPSDAVILRVGQKVVDGRPAPIGANLSGLVCRTASMPPPLPLLSPLPPRIKASSQPHKRYGIKHDRANAAATQAVSGWRIVRRGSGGRRGRGDDFRGGQIQRLERPLRETRLRARGRINESPGESTGPHVSWCAQVPHPRLCSVQHRSRGWRACAACAGHDTVRTTAAPIGALVSLQALS